MTRTASTSGFMSCLPIVVEHVGMHWRLEGVCMATSDSDIFSPHVLLLSNVWNNCMSLLVYFSYENTLFLYQWFPGFNIITDNFVRKLACQFWFCVFPLEVSRDLHMLGVKFIPLWLVMAPSCCAGSSLEGSLCPCLCSSEASPHTPG